MARDAYVFGLQLADSLFLKEEFSTSLKLFSSE